MNYSGEDTLLQRNNRPQSKFNHLYCIIEIFIGIADNCFNVTVLGQLLSHHSRFKEFNEP